MIVKYIWTSPYKIETCRDCHMRNLEVKSYKGLIPQYLCRHPQKKGLHIVPDMREGLPEGCPLKEQNAEMER